jgi:hypothetical protein
MRLEIPVLVTVEVLVQVEDLGSDQLNREERSILNGEAEGAAIELVHKKLGRRRLHTYGTPTSAKALKSDWSWIEGRERADVRFTMPGWRHLRERERA